MSAAKSRSSRQGFARRRSRPKVLNVLPSSQGERAVSHADVEPRFHVRHFATHEMSANRGGARGLPRLLHHPGDQSCSRIADRPPKADKRRANVLLPPCLQGTSREAGECRGFVLSEEELFLFVFRILHRRA